MPDRTPAGRPLLFPTTGHLSMKTNDENEQEHNTQMMQHRQETPPAYKEEMPQAPMATHGIPPLSQKKTDPRTQNSAQSTRIHRSPITEP